MRERRSFPISGEVALKPDKDAGKGRVNSVICGVVDELSNGRSRRGSWVRHAVMGVLRWKDLTGVRTSTPTEQKEVIDHKTQVKIFDNGKVIVSILSTNIIFVKLITRSHAHSKIDLRQNQTSRFVVK